MQNKPIHKGSTQDDVDFPGPETPAANSNGQLGRRTFMKRLGMGGTVLLPATAWLASRTAASAAGFRGRLTRGDIAILRLLAAAEIIEWDLWLQYQGLALGNAAYQLALQSLDGDMPSYVHQNNRDEFTHQNFLNAYLVSKGHKPVSLEPFRTLSGSQATGANKTARRLTSLMNLTVDTSWYTRYRSTGNPDFGDTFPQIVNLVDLPTIPNSDLPLPTDPDGFK